MDKRVAVFLFFVSSMLVLNIFDKNSITFLFFVLFVILGYAISKEDGLVRKCLASGIMVMAAGMVAYAILENINIAPNLFWHMDYIINIIILGFYLIISSVVAMSLKRLRSVRPGGYAIAEHRQNLFYTAIAILLIFSFVQSFAIFKGGYYDNVDSGLANYFIPGYLQASASAWNSQYYTGSMSAGVNTVPGILISLSEYLLFTAFGNVVGAEIFYGIIIAIGSIGMLLLVYELTYALRPFARFAAGIFGALIFSAYFYPQYGPSHALNAAFLPLTLFLLFILYKKVDSGKARLADAALPAISLSALIGIGQIGYIIPNAAIVGSLLLAFVLLGNRKKLQFKYALLIIIFVLLIDSTMFVSLFFYLENSYANFFNGFSSNILLTANQQSLLTVLDVYGINIPSLVLQYANNNIAIMLAESVIVAVGIMSLYLWKDEFPDVQVFMFGMVIAVLLLIFFYVNLGPPFGYLFKLIYKGSSVLLAVRQSNPVFYYTIFIIEGLLFALGFSYLADRLRGNYKLVLIALVILAICVRVYYFDVVPLSSVGSISIPDYYQQAASYINNQSGTFNVALLPAEFPFEHYASFYHGTDIYSYLIEKPVFTGGYVATNYGQVAASATEKEYFNISNTIQNSPIQNKSYISNRLSKYGIKYIVIQRDSAPNGTANGYLRYNYSAIYDNLNSSHNISLVRNYQNVSVYENNKALPLIFASNASASFAEVSPTRIIVNVSNTIGNASIFLRYTYNKYWIAQYANGTILPGHSVGNEYMNEWSVRNYSGTVLIYYGLDYPLNISWVISIVAFALIALLATYAYRKNRKFSVHYGEKKEYGHEEIEINIKTTMSNPIFIAGLSAIVIIVLVFNFTGGNLFVSNVVLNNATGIITVSDNFSSNQSVYGVFVSIPNFTIRNLADGAGPVFFYKNASVVDSCAVMYGDKGLNYFLYDLGLNGNHSNVSVYYKILYNRTENACNKNVFNPPNGSS